jgi:type II secretory ATPase GspE/PulE/Tfp pilus assembly ATPase PilB-like protein
MAARRGSMTLSWPVASFLAMAASAACGAEPGWPSFSPGSSDPGWLARDTGGGLAIVPMACWWLVSLGWMSTASWVSRDSAARDIHTNLWAALATFPFVAAALLAWSIPSALLGQILMLLAWLAPALTYCVLRNRAVKESERVLTPRHFRRLAAGLLGRFGVRIATEAAVDDGQPTVNLVAAGGKNADENKLRLEQAAAMPGFGEATQVMLGAVMGRASTVMLEAGTDTFSVRHEVDGVWHPPRVRKEPRSRKEKETWVEAAAIDHASGLAVLRAFEALAGLDPQSRAAQRGVFVAQVDGKPRSCHLRTKVAISGAQMVVTIESPGVVFKTFSDLAMSAPLSTKLAELLTLEKGLIVLSGPTGSGLTTTFDVVVQAADRLLRDFVSIEDAADPPREIQNVKPVRFDARTGVTAVAALETAMRDYPSAIVTRDLRDRDLAAALAERAADKQLVIMSMKADGATEAAAKLVAAGVPADLLARTLLGSVSQRLVRKLCPRCREEYPTPPDLLMRLKRTAEQLPHLQRASPHGCRVCWGTGYFGRMPIFELASGATFRKAIAEKADPKLLRQAAVKDGMRPLADMGMELVIEGVTSLDEMQRVFAAKKG